jgi:hypothetical protein
MFSTEGQELKTGGLNKTMEPGVVYAHIHGANVRTAKSGKKALELILETPPIENFEGWAIDKENPEGPKFKGQSARVSATVYTEHFTDSNINKNDILNKIVMISMVLDLRKEIDALANDKSITSIEAYVEKAIDILKGRDLYWFLAGKEDEYNDKIIVRLSLPKYKFCADDESFLNKFDKSNKYHYSPYVSKSIGSFEAASNDFEL